MIRRGVILEAAQRDLGVHSARRLHLPWPLPLRSRPELEVRLQLGDRSIPFDEALAANPGVREFVSAEGVFVQTGLTQETTVGGLFFVGGLSQFWDVKI